MLLATDPRSLYTTYAIYVHYFDRPRAASASLAAFATTVPEHHDVQLTDNTARSVDHADGEQEGRQLVQERTRIERLGRIRELVFGSLDGLIRLLGVVSGVAGGVDPRAVIVAGIADAFAGARSIGDGAARYRSADPSAMSIPVSGCGRPAHHGQQQQR